VQQPEPAGRLEAGLPTVDRSDPPIRACGTAVTAFVGRTLKGPVGEPVRITDFAQFVQIFGGLWQPSTLSYAVDQFFENGGEEALVVRVVSAGRAPTIDLPAGAEWLILSGLLPGSREYLRASVDYDGIDPAETCLFNLVVQRVRAPGSELVEAQEIFRRVSVEDDAPRHLAAVLAGSRLVRLVGPAPRQRPDITPGIGPYRFVGYIACNADGDDGDPLSDYDVIGNESLRRGLFALEGHAFNFLCIPPLTHDRDLGMSTLVVAGRFCRRHQALLVVDPPSAWVDESSALLGVAHWPFHSADAVMFFPRIETIDRLKGRPGTFASCGVAAGLLARADRSGSHWWSTESSHLTLRPTLKPACAVGDRVRAQLATRGVNVLVQARGQPRSGPSTRTLAGGPPRKADSRTLLARRMLLWIAASVERGTQDVTLIGNHPISRERVRARVHRFLGELVAQGALAAAGISGTPFVICDERLNGDVALAAGEFHLLYGFQPEDGREPEAWRVTHRPGNSQTRPVTVNPHALGSRP
jgi:uncharacterized protein